MAFDTIPAKPPVGPAAGLHGQPRAFLRRLGYAPRDWYGAHTVKAFLHDNAYHCDVCEDWFPSAGDMADDREDECHWCRWGLHKPGLRKPGEAIPLRTPGSVEDLSARLMVSIRQRAAERAA